MKLPLNNILWIAVTVLITLQVKSCFTKTPPNEKLIRTEEQIKQVEQKRISDSLLNASFGKTTPDELPIAVIFTVVIIPPKKYAIARPYKCYNMRNNARQCVHTL